MQVRKKDTGKAYAMKVLRKDNIVRRNQGKFIDLCINCKASLTLQRVLQCKYLIYLLCYHTNR